MAKRRLLFDRLEDRLCMAAPTLQTSFQLPQQGSWTPTPYRSSPLMVDIFGTGKDDLIAVAAGAKLVAYASNPDGSATPVVTYQVPGGMADIKSTPIVVTDPRTGRKDLFAAMGRDESTDNPALEDGRVFGWDLQTGQLLPGWTQGQSTGRSVSGESGVYGALTSGQLENNGMPDIVATSFSTNVVAFRLDGSTLWTWTNDDTILSGAVIGDIDRDGHQEVVVGGDSSNSPFYKAGGWVNVLSDTGTLKYRTFIPGEVTWSSPLLADLNNNGYLDIVIGTGLNYDASGVPGARALGNNIYAIDPFGHILPGWPYHTTNNDSQAHQVLAGLAAADLTGNGQLDVVAVDRSGFVHVIQPNGQPLPGFVGGKPIAPGFAPGTLPDNYSSPIIADVTGSGSPEIVAAEGPFLVALDRFGNITPIATTGNAPGGTNEGIDAAAVVGHFDGGSGLNLAYVSYNPVLQNRPDQVQIYQLSPTAVAPPWPSMRRTASGDAVERSPAFDRNYVASAFFAALGYLPDQATLNAFQGALDSDNLNLLTTALTINTGPLARQAEVQRVYQRFLGRAADPSGLAAFTNFLATNTYRDLEIFAASSPEFAQRAGNNPAQEVVQLYQAILNRAPTPAETNLWVSTKLPPGTLASIFINNDGLGVQLGALYAASFGPGAQNFIPPDAFAAYAFDIHHGAREEVVNANILASNGNYAATNLLAGYVRDLYRDVLGRDASPSDTATWLRLMDNGTVSPMDLPNFFLNSPEARTDYIQQEFQALLGHGADAATVGALLNYQTRESAILFLVGGPEYFARAGGTYAGFVQAVFRDLGGIQIDPASLNAFVTKLNAGLISPLGVAQQIIYGGTLYTTNTIVNELMRYLPDETQGVLRSGNLRPTAREQPINPSPVLINYLQALQASGFTDEQIIGVILTSPQCLSRISYVKGLYRSPGIRN